MSANRKGIYRPFIQRWTQSVSLMLCEQLDGATVKFTCSKCKFYRVADLAKLVRANPLTCLWERRPPCPKCGSAGLFLASPREGTPMYPPTLDDPKQVAKLHELSEMVERAMKGFVG
jgi:hypothetical protein